MTGDVGGPNEGECANGEGGKSATPPKTAITGYGGGDGGKANEGGENSASPPKNWIRSGLHWARHRVSRTKFADWAIILLTAVIAYSTYSSDRTFRRQLAEMRGSSIQTDRAIELSLQNGATVAYQAALTARALKIAGDNAEYALGQLATAQDTERRQLQAYLYVKANQVRDFAVGKVPRWGITFGIIGQTPAYSAAVRQQVSIFPYPDALGVETLRWEQPKNSSYQNAIYPNNVKHAEASLSCYTIDRPMRNPSTAISAQGTLKRITDCVLTDGLLVGLQGGHFKMYLLGVVTYRDAFHAPHHTPFCFTYDITPHDGSDGDSCEKNLAPD